MISATAWIRKGAACAEPKRIELTEEQYDEIMQRSKAEVEEARQEIQDLKQKKTKKAKSKPITALEEDLAKFNLDNYSDEQESEGENCPSAFFDMISTVDEAALTENAEEIEETGAPDDSEEEDDLRILPTDSLLVACRTEDEVSYLEVYVYEEEEENLYVHHDVMLPAFPLCVEWIGCPLADTASRTLGNYAAVGTFDLEIEIWSLDVMEAIYPAMVLGPSESKKKDKKKNAKKLPIDPLRHTDAVMSLSWNKLHQSLLLSGSADHTIKLWDLANGGRVVTSFDTLHQDKVQTLQWNPANVSLAASAAYDKNIFVFDCRTPTDALRWSLTTGGDPECLRWDPHNANRFAISDERGTVQVFDTRAGSASSPVFSLVAHDRPVTSIDWNPTISDCLLTVSADRSAKLWNTAEANPRCIVARPLNDAGKIFSGSFCPDSPHLITVSGSKGIVKVLNFLRDPAVIEGFKGQLPN